MNQREVILSAGREAEYVVIVPPPESEPDQDVELNWWGEGEIADVIAFFTHAPEGSLLLLPIRINRPNPTEAMLQAKWDMARHMKGNAE